MQFIKKNYGIFIGVFFLLCFCFYISKDAQKVRMYEKNIPFHRSYVNIQIYTKDIKIGKEVIEKLENLYTHYNSLITRKDNKEKGIFYIENNTKKVKQLEISSDLYTLLELAQTWEEKSAEKINISSFPLQDIWNHNIEKENIVTEEETQKEKNNISLLKLLGNNKILNNHVSINLDGIINGYVSLKAQDILNKYGISTYLINTDGVILSGKSYDKKYKIVLEDTFSHDYYHFLQIENIAVSTKGIGEKAFLQNETIYHNRIDPSTGKPSSYHRGVSVITQDPLLADFLSLVLFHMSIEEGKKYIKTYQGVEVIWYSSDKKITSTKGAFKYNLVTH